MSTGQLHDSADDQPTILTKRFVSLAELLYGGKATCDSCGSWQEFTGFSAPHAQQQLSEHGWVFGDADLCPRCAPPKET